MRTHRSLTALPALVLAGAIGLTAAACGTAGPSASPQPSTGTPTSGPATPKPSPTNVATNPRVTLDVASDAVIVAVINDRTGSLVEATSGTAAATMSVKWFESIVENVDANTIEITFVGFPRDEEVTVELSKSGETLSIDINQAAPPLNSDAEGADRVLVLELDEAVSADDVEVTFSAAQPA